MSSVADVLASLQQAGVQVEWQGGFTQGSVVKFLDYPHPVQIYAWQVSDNGQATGVDRAADERRIQVTRRVKILPDVDGETVILGWSEDFGPVPVIVAFNPYGVASRVNLKIDRRLRHRAQVVRVSDSQQFRQALLDEAAINGLAVGMNQHGDEVIAVRPENFIYYLQHLKHIRHRNRSVEEPVNGGPRTMVELMADAELEIFGAPVPELEGLPNDFDLQEIEDGRERIARELVVRRGQAGFRNQLLAIYGCCAMSGCDLPEVLEAAHIVAYLGPGTNHVQNGLLLRSDLHALFDLGLLAFDENSFTILVSARLNGTEYEGLRGLVFRSQSEFRPSAAALAHHRQFFVR